MIIFKGACWQRIPWPSTGSPEWDFEVDEEIARCADWYKSQWAVNDGGERVENEWTGKQVLDVTVHAELKISIFNSDILLFEENVANGETNVTSDEIKITRKVVFFQVIKID